LIEALLYSVEICEYWSENSRVCVGCVGVYWEVLIFIRLKAEVILQGLVVWFIGVVIVLCILLSREFL
jgi:hypothetical protein